MSRMRHFGSLLIGLVVACCSCGTIESAADQVSLTSDEVAVRGCSFQAFVQARNPYESQSEVVSDLREEAVDHGGNTVLLLNHSGGEAFSCPAMDSTHPSATQPPASFVPASQMRSEVHTEPYCPAPID